MALPRSPPLRPSGQEDSPPPEDTDRVSLIGQATADYAELVQAFRALQEQFQAQQRELQELRQQYPPRSETLREVPPSLRSESIPPMLTPPPPTPTPLPSTSVTPPPPQSAPAPEPLKVREPKLDLPPEFSGSIKEFRYFMAQCNLHFTLCPSMFPKPENKVLFVVSRFRGTAASWALSIATDENHPMRKDYAAFYKALTSIYDNTNLRAQAASKLDRLYQTGSVSEYAATFQSLLVDCGYDDSEESKCDRFYRHLSGTVKDALAVVEREKTLEGLIRQCVRIDQRQYEWKFDVRRPANPQTSANPSSSSSGAPSATRQNSKPSTALGSSRPQGSTLSAPLPFLVNGHLSPEEKKRREDNNLCRYCGGANHTFDTCSRRKSSAPPAK
jgi:Retrotransposon gag protein